MNGGTSHASEFTKSVIRRFLVIFIPLAGLVLTTAVIHYNTELQTRQNSLIAEESHFVELSRRTIANNLRTVVGDLMFLAKLNELLDLLDDPSDERARLLLAQEFLYFNETKRIYDQIRLLDAQGLEIIRVNYDDGYPRIVPNNELQNKANRYYFREAMALDLGQFYSSPFDLNMEEGKIVEPRKPVIRFATPLFNSHGEKRGMLMFNFLGDKLIQGFKQAANPIVSHIHLLNPEGYWLSSPQPEDEWGFMYKHQRAFSKSYPDAWQQALKKDEGYFFNADGLISFATIYPSSAVREIYEERGFRDIGEATQSLFANSTQFWKLIALVSPKTLDFLSRQFLQEQLLLYSSTSLFLLLASMILAWSSTKNHFQKSQKEFEQRFRNTLNTMQLAAVTLNPMGQITFCNDFLLKLTGWSRDEIINGDWFETFVHPEDRPKARRRFDEMIKGNAPPGHPDTRIRTHQGKTLFLSWENSVSWDTGGKVTAITRIGEDITQSRKTSAQLHKLSRAVEQSPNPVIITNNKGIIEYVNPKFTQLTGYSAKEAIGERPSILKSGETDDQEYQQLWETITRGEEWRGVFHNRKKSGELYWESTAISAIRDTGGNITHFLAVKEDITERRQLKEEVKRRNQELAHAQTLAAMGRMASMIAHDLRNPLSSVKMTLQILGKRTPETMGSEVEELQGIALGQVRYMEDILADLLLYSRPDALKPDWLSINKLLDTAISTTEKTIQDYGAKVITEYQAQLPTLHGDATKLMRVFSNLITNALAASDGTDQTPEIHIYTSLELSDSAPKIRVDICDNGPGIDPNRIKQFLEPFFTTRAKGTGLGLAIVKRIVEQHNGSFSLTPIENDSGTCASVILPTTPIE